MASGGITLGKTNAVMEPELEMSQRHVTEEIRDRLAVVGPADGLGQDHGNVDNLQRLKTEHLYDSITNVF